MTLNFFSNGYHVVTSDEGIAHIYTPNQTNNEDASNNNNSNNKNKSFSQSITSNKKTRNKNNNKKKRKDNTPPTIHFYLKKKLHNPGLIMEIDEKYALSRSLGIGYLIDLETGEKLYGRTIGIQSI